MAKEQYGMGMSCSGGSYFGSSSNSATNKLLQMKQQKRHQIEQNEIKIIKNKRLIESLENAIQNSEDELRSIMVGQISYYKTSLKLGMDCRDTGLGWILKKLRALIVNKDKENTINGNTSTPSKD